MMPLSMKTYLALLWVISVVYAMESDTNASTTVNTTEGAAHPSHIVLETAKPTEDQIHQQSPTTSTDMTAPATASVATVAVSSQRPSSTTKPDVTSKLSPITSPENVQAPVFNQTHSFPSASATTTMTARPTSGAAPVFDPTIRETFPTSTELLSTSKLVSVTKTPNSTSQFPGTAGLSSTAESPTIKISTESPISTTKVSTTDVSTTEVSTTNVSTTNVSTTEVSTTNVSTTNVSTTEVSTTEVSTTNVSTTNVSTTEVSTTDVSTTKVSTTDVSTTEVFTTDVSTTNVSTTNVSTSPTGILIPGEPKKSPVPTTKSTPVTTTAPREVSKTQPCSTRREANHCLIVIASLAALATVFMVSTIILCTKLSKRNYKVKKPQPATEMMCISSLLPERNITYSRQRNPITNGVLVIHDDADSDEDGGDNLTLSSFLPENDRFV